MQKNLSENTAPKGPGKAVKYILLAFVVVSVGAVIYKNLPCCSGDKSRTAPVEAAAVAQCPASVAASEAKAPAAKAAKPAAKAPVEAKTAVVYYFYTNTRCSSCKTIEAYTREAVATRLAAGYNGWKIEFKGVNVDDKANEHFIRDYWLNSKSVVVQKFEGDKPLNWGLLKDVWQLLGDKEVFMNYIASETKKVIDAK